jgi:hypothetical protein
MPDLARDGLGGLDRLDPATLAAWAEARGLEDKRVTDVNGLALGRITRCVEEDGALVRCDVTLTGAAKRVLAAPQDVVGVPTDWIAVVDDDGVRLRKAGEELVRPEDPRPVGAEADERGAPELPRKNR